MTFRVSTGLRSQLLDTNPLKTVLNLGKILVYSGPSPATADAAVTGTLLCTITNNSTATGLTFAAAAAAGVLSKNAAETWSGVNAATGTAGYYRHVGSADDGTLSTTQPRLQGDIATAGAELNLSSVALANGATQTIDYYNVSLPTL